MNLLTKLPVAVRCLRRPAGRQAGEDGLVTLEFALVFPLLVFLLMGVLEFGHLWYVKTTLTAASREGARYAVKRQTAGALPTDAAIRTVVADYLGNGFVSAYMSNGINDIQVNRAGNNAGDGIVVAVDANQNLTFVLQFFVPSFGTMTLASGTQMRIQ